MTHLTWGSIIWLPIAVVAIGFVRITLDLWMSRRERR